MRGQGSKVGCGIGTSGFPRQHGTKTFKLGSLYYHLTSKNTHSAQRLVQTLLTILDFTFFNLWNLHRTEFYHFTQRSDGCLPSRLKRGNCNWGCKQTQTRSCLCDKHRTGSERLETRAIIGCEFGARINLKILGGFRPNRFIST
jgi:hypothetical protein